MKKRPSPVFPIMAFCCMVCVYGTSDAVARGNTIKVLTSTFPIHQITRNVVREREGLSVSLMISSRLGCPHDYLLTPQDMRKLADADVLVINGLGMEEFLGVPVRQANPGLRIIDSSAGIKDLIHFTDPSNRGKGGHQHHANDHDRHDRREDVNPHLFTSPRMAARLALNIATGLSEVDPAGAGHYIANARAYADQLNLLAEKFSVLGTTLINRRVVTQHGAFDYLARDIGLEIVAFMQPHAGQEPSATEMLNLIERIHRIQPAAILIEPQYPDKTGRALAVETGVPLVKVDPVAGGPENAPLEYYETVMRANLTMLEKSLGER